MSLDLSKLENLKRRGDGYEAACPACRVAGRDKTGNHLHVYADGRFGCAAAANDPEHRKQIFALVGAAAATEMPARSLPQFRDLTSSEVNRIAQTRDLPLTAGIEIARRRGLVHGCDLRDGPGDPVPCWAIADKVHPVAQARRMDGKPFSHRWDGGSKTWRACTPFKAKTIGPAGWPVGAPEIGDRPCVLVTEGSTDFLAAHLLAFWFGVGDRVAVVAMLGAGQSIPGKAAHYFKGKRCRILIDNDAAGEKAAARWAMQLHRAGASHVSGTRWQGCLMLDGSPVKDTNDFVSTLDLEIEPSFNPLEGLVLETLEAAA